MPILLGQYYCLAVRRQLHDRCPPLENPGNVHGHVAVSGCDGLPVNIYPTVMAPLSNVGPKVRGRLAAQGGRTFALAPGHRSASYAAPRPRPKRGSARRWGPMRCARPSTVGARAPLSAYDWAAMGRRQSSLRLGPDPMPHSVAPTLSRTA